jgi:acetyltransferase-like isoleucine patch superfamily enzyme
MKHKGALLWSWFIGRITSFLPDSPHTMRLRGWLYGIAMKQRGKDFQVGNNVCLRGLENISVGNHVYFAPNVVILTSQEIIIEDEVMLAFNTVVTDGNHPLQNGSYRFGKRETSPVRIGRGAWIGANCTITAGVSIGKGSLVAANSAVVKDLPDHIIAGGVPARIIRRTPISSEISGIS